MAYAWQTVEQAAITLGISSRTLHRRIAKGELETRLEDGRREVMVCLPESPALSPAAPSDTPPVTRSQQPLGAEAITPPVSQAAASPLPKPELASIVSDTSLALTEDRFRRMELAINAFQKAADSSAAEVKRARSVSYVAWSTVGGLVAIVIIALVWAVHRDTWAQADIKRLSGEVARLTDESSARAKDLSVMRQELENARLTSARADGELTVTRLMLTSLTAANQSPPPRAAAPTTKPAAAMVSGIELPSLKW
jgi:hypothetical protein